MSISTDFVYLVHYLIIECQILTFDWLVYTTIPNFEATIFIFISISTIQPANETR